MLMSGTDISYHVIFLKISSFYDSFLILNIHPEPDSKWNIFCSVVDLMYGEECEI